MNGAALPSALPVYTVRLLPSASRSLDEAVIHVAKTSGKEEAEAGVYASNFRRELFTAVGTLATLALRFPLAPEVARFSPPPVRAMPFCFRDGGPIWRVLYRVYEADENNPARVEIVTIRHGAQKPLTRAEGHDIDAANR